MDLAAGPDRILVHRPGWRAQVASLARGEFRFLAAARDGAALGDALQAGLAEEPGFDAGAALARWVAAAVIVDLA